MNSRTANKATFGTTIRFFRNEIGMTQKQYSARLGIKYSTLGAYEEGRAFPPVPLIKKIADIHDVPIDRLFKGIEIE